MKCDVCGQETYIVYIDDEHRQVCDCCHMPNEADDFVDKWETNPKRYTIAEAVL